MSNLRVISTSSGTNRAVHDTDVGLLGGVGTAASSGQTFKIYGETGNLAFTISTNGNISFENIVITNIVFDNLTHEISPTTQTATNNGGGVILVSGAGGVASGGSDGGDGGTTTVLSGTGGAAAAGAGAAGAGGDVNITAASGGLGTATGIGGAGGNVSINGGNAGTDNGAGGNDGGNLTIDSGVATGAGTNGDISIGTAIASSMTIANGTIAVTASGSWTFSNGILTPTIVEASTAGSGAPNILTAGESRKTLTNEGASAEAYNTLPTAVAGLRFQFVCQDGDGIRVTANTGDTIKLGTATVSASAGFVKSTVVGSALILEAINATEWMGISIVGTWTVDA